MDSFTVRHKTNIDYKIICFVWPIRTVFPCFLFIFLPVNFLPKYMDIYIFVFTCVNFKTSKQVEIICLNIIIIMQNAMLLVFTAQSIPVNIFRNFTCSE